jgi:hypothetical protein
MDLIFVPKLLFGIAALVVVSLLIILRKEK